MTARESDQLLALKQKIEQMRSKRDRAQGSLQTTLKILQIEFGCESIREAKALLATMNEDVETAKADFDVAMTDFNKRWGDKLAV